MKYKYSSDLRLCSAVRMPFSPAILRLSRAPLKLMFALTRTRGVGVRAVDCGGQKLWIFEPDGVCDSSPCLLFLHGGGFGFGAAPHHKRLAANIAADVRCRVLMPDYRLLPQHPFPAAREDCLAAYRFICKNYPDAAIAVMGDSAGGTLTVGVCADAAFSSLKIPCLQLLLYPVADGAMSCRSLADFASAPMWSARNNRDMWRMYLDGQSPNEASPLHMPLPQPPTDAYIELAQWDCLHDEGAMLAERLKSCGAQVELHTVEGAPHGFDLMMHSAAATTCFEMRTAALCRAFYPHT